MSEPSEFRLFLRSSCAPCAMRQGNQSYFGRARSLTNMERHAFEWLYETMWD